MAHPSDTSDTTFDSDVIKSDLPVLVDFWAPWCGPCRMVAPIVEELADEYEGKVKFVKLNTDENPQIAGKYGIRSIPTLLVFRDGLLLFQQAGMLPAAALDELMRKVRSVDMDAVRRRLGAHETKGAAV